MKHRTVILLTLFVLQIYALPQPLSTPSLIKNKESTIRSTSVQPKKTNEPSSITTVTKVEQKPEKYSSESPKTTIPGKTDADNIGNTKVAQTSIPVDESARRGNVGVKTPISNTSNISTTTKRNQKSSPRPQATSTRSNKDNVDSTTGTLITESSGTTSLSSSIPKSTKIETMQNRPPSYYYDMFNIPIAALQAVSNFLGGAPLNTNLNPPATSRPPVAKDLLRSPIQLSSGTAPAEVGMGGNASPLNIPGLNAISQISQIANSKPGLLLRLPTVQDIFNIPISTLNAVSHFLASNYATQPNQSSSTQPVTVNSNPQPNIVPIESATDPKKGIFLKSGQILQTLQNIPDHSTLIGVTEDVGLVTNAQTTSEQKQVLITNPTYYQNMINIPIATLKAVNDFLTTVYADPLITAVPSTVQENKITTTELLPPSIKTSQTFAEVTSESLDSTRVVDAEALQLRSVSKPCTDCKTLDDKKINRIGRLVIDSVMHVVTDKSSENSVLSGPVEDKRSSEELTLAEEKK